MFGQQEGELAFGWRAPEKRKEIWRKLGIFPRGIDREVVEADAPHVTSGWTRRWRTSYTRLPAARLPTAGAAP